MTLPRMSHSRYEVYATCGERYRLEKIERVPKTPSIYAIAGTAFHEWTDYFDGTLPIDVKMDHVDWWQDRLTDLVDESVEKSGFELREWDNPKRSADLNKTAFEKFRDEIGPDMISKYIEWRKQTFWNVEAIELELTYQLGDVRGIAKVDRVFYRPEQDDLIAVDTKTWSKKRVTAQLPTYLVALRQNGWGVSGAAYYEARKGTCTEPLSYKYWDENRLAALHQQAAHMISEGWFLPAPGEQCRMCDVRRFCQFYVD